MVLINLDTDKIFSLNITGAKAWEMIEDTRDIDIVKQGMLAQFDVTPEVLDDELTRILGALEAEGFITLDL